MKRRWELEELIEHWTILPNELSWLSNKIGANRLGIALLLKFFQYATRFPISPQEIPDEVVDYIALQVQVSSELYRDYNWKSRTYMRHRSEIRTFLGIRQATVKDASTMVDWLVSEILQTEAELEHLKEIVDQRFQLLKIEPPTSGRIERIVRSARKTYETQFFSRTFSQLPPSCRTAIDELLSLNKTVSTTEPEGDDLPKSSLFHYLNSSPGRVSLNSLLTEVSKLQYLRQISLPEDLFQDVSAKVLQTYAARAATEDIFQLRTHPEPIRYSLVAAFSWLKTQEVTDNLVDLLLQMVHGIGTRAEKKVDAEIIQDLKRVTGKHNILYNLAHASLEKPEGIVKEVIYPVVSQQTLRNLVKELKANGTAYKQKVHTVIRSSYSRHYRRALPKLLEVLEFRSNNDVHRPVIEALELLKKYASDSSRYYSPDEDVPLEGVIKSGWQEILLEQDTKGNQRINRINYEICVLQGLRERLRCKEIWVVGANRYRNPELDLPTDFEQHRKAYYQALNLPQNASEFIASLKERMETALSTFNDGLSQNPKVEILQVGKIRLSPLEAQPEPTNIRRLKAELRGRWPMTSLLDILKEADLREGFTDCFKSLAAREVLERETIQKRLLLCLYGLGTNTGLKRVSHGTPSVDYHDLCYIKRRFINASALRKAIAEIVNAIFRARQPHIWGEGTTTCASDAKKFGAWDQNLMTEWHVRYGGPGIMIYWHVEKKSTCIYSQLKSCSSSEVAAMIEGVLRHDTEMTVKKNFTDSHGQSEVAFAFTHLLGFELMPRLKGIKRQKLYRPEAGQSDAYDNLQPILTRTINWELIRQQYDQMVKYATALRLGTAEPEAILRRFTRNNLKHPTYQALGELGKVLKTIFLCQYLHSEALRREIHEGLNVVEQWNSTNGFILYGKSGEFATNQRDEQVLVMLSLHLLQVCLVYINTLMLQRVLSDPPWSQRLTDDDRRALTPLIYGHVNPYGTFRLDMEERLVIEREAA